MDKEIKTQIRHDLKKIAKAVNQLLKDLDKTDKEIENEKMAT